MPAIHVFARASTSTKSTGMDSLTMRLVVAFLVLLVVALLLVGTLFFLRHMRNKRTSRGIELGSSISLTDAISPTGSGEKSARASQAGLTITTTTKRSPSGRRTDSFVHVSRLSTSSMQRQSFLGAPAQQSAIPEIRITFPDETDESGKLLSSGRVVVVRMGDNASSGDHVSDTARSSLSKDDGLPPYTKADGFVAVELADRNPVRR